MVAIVVYSIRTFRLHKLFPTILLPLFIEAVIRRSLVVWFVAECTAAALRVCVCVPLHCRAIAFQNKLSKPSSSVGSQSLGRNDCNCRSPYSLLLSTEIVFFFPVQTESRYFSTVAFPISRFVLGCDFVRRHSVLCVVCETWLFGRE